jgi:para-aminobenzoate synthetase component I
MTKDFPYILLNKHQIAEQINRLAAARIPFLFIIDYKATHGYVIKQDELDNEFIRFEIESASKPTLVLADI